MLFFRSDSHLVLAVVTVADVEKLAGTRRRWLVAKSASGAFGGPLPCASSALPNPGRWTVTMSKDGSSLYLSKVCGMKVVFK